MRDSSSSESLDINNNTYSYSGERNEQGERQGHGRALLENGDQYIGEYKHGVRHGYGEYIFWKKGKKIYLYINIFWEKRR